MLGRIYQQGRGASFASPLTSPRPLRYPLDVNEIEAARQAAVDKWIGPEGVESLVVFARRLLASDRPAVPKPVIEQIVELRFERCRRGPLPKGALLEIGQDLYAKLLSQIPRILYTGQTGTVLGLRIVPVRERGRLEIVDGPTA